MLAKMTVEDFLSDLSSSLPAPGGGAAAALAAAMGAALISMVCNLTIGKKQYEQYEAEMIQVRQRAQKLKDEVLLLMDADARAFSELMQSFKLPANTDGEKEKRTEQIQAKTRQAAEVPAKIAASCLEIAALADQIAGKANKNLESDIKVGIDMAEAGLNSAITNIKVNLPGIKDQGYVAEKQALMNKMTSEFSRWKLSVASKLEIYKL